MYNLLANTLAVTPVIAAELIFAAVVAKVPVAIEVLFTNNVPDCVLEYVELTATGQLAFHALDPSSTH